MSCPSYLYLLINLVTCTRSNSSLHPSILPSKLKIEVPRAALVAGELAKNGAEFFSYGTNDLTQMTFGFSRDDVGTFLPAYLKAGILDKDPFQVIDEEGVGSLIVRSAKDGKKSAVHGISKVFQCCLSSSRFKCSRWLYCHGVIRSDPVKAVEPTLTLSQ